MSIILRQNKSDKTEYIDKLFQSIDHLIVASNDNEKKLDDIFLKQTTIPNLVFSAAFLYPNFLCLLRIEPILKIFYIIVLGSFFLSIFFTIFNTICEHINIDKNLEKSRLLFTRVRYHRLMDDEKSEISNIVKSNNAGVRNFRWFKFLRWCERLTRLLNALACTIFIIYGVIIYV